MRTSGALFRILAAICVSLAIYAAQPAQARTAVYVAPASIAPGAVSALSAQGDGAGYLVPLNQTLALLFSQPFGTLRNSDRITVYTLAPPSGTARAVVSFGVWNNGAPIVIRSQNVTAGNSLTVGNLFQQGCGVFQGCDYIAITTDRARNGAAGVNVDYIDVNGEVTEVTAPTPAPATWSLMIVGFIGAAWRLKAQKSGRRRDRPWAQRYSRAPRPSSG